MRFYRLAFKQGYAGAMFNLAKDLSSGVGCLQDPVLAVLWMRRGAELGYPEAQGQLGAWYLLGAGSPLPVNYKEALRPRGLKKNKKADRHASVRAGSRACTRTRRRPSGVILALHCAPLRAAESQWRV